MSVATGTVQIYRLRFWRTIPIIFRHFSGTMNVVNLQAYSKFSNLNPNLWTFQNKPEWITREDNQLRLNPTHGESGTFDMTITYDNLYNNVMRVILGEKDFLWSDARGIVWTDSRGIAWGERV